jgi:hypothetical protein
MMNRVGTIKRGGFPYMNPNIYFNPTTFDLERYPEGREEDRKREIFSYMGWEVGMVKFVYPSRWKIQPPIVIHMLGRRSSNWKLN